MGRKKMEYKEDDENKVEELLPELEEVTEFEPLKKLSKDIRNAAKHMGREEVGFLVQSYYSTQEKRKASANQIRSIEKSNQEKLAAGGNVVSFEVLKWHLANNEMQEQQLKLALGHFVKNDPVGKWLVSIAGIGPVLAAGLLAYIDITQSPTAGHILSFAGYKPDVKWEKGQKRPFCAKFKTILWLIGESFVKVMNSKNDFYGSYYKKRKEYEEANNEKLLYAGQAAQKLKDYNIGKDTKAFKYYSIGKLPPAHIHARAKRWTVSLFISHLHHVMFCEKFNALPPIPYILEYGGHVHYIKPPYYDGLHYETITVNRKNDLPVSFVIPQSSIETDFVDIMVCKAGEILYDYPAKVSK